MDPTELANLLATLSPDEIDAAAEELHAYARHRRIEPRGDVAAAPFNRKQFFINLWKLIQVIGPAVGPFLGADANVADPAKSE